MDSGQAAICASPDVSFSSISLVSIIFKDVNENVQVRSSIVVCSKVCNQSVIAHLFFFPRLTLIPQLGLSLSTRQFA